MCSGTAIVALALQCSFAACHRNTDSKLLLEDSLNVDSHDEVFIHSFHAQGLEDEHSFQHISHRSNASTDSAWEATESDETTIGQILSKLNPPGADAPWTWYNDEDHWTFGLVKLTASTAKRSLALHMLHRHGLAPLLAARAGRSFENFLKGCRDSASLEDLVKCEEMFDDVKDMHALLESLTLSGLRSLHSFDHQWSVDTFSGKVRGCSQSDAGECILQAGASAAAHDLLAGHGMLGEKGHDIISKFEHVMGTLNNWTNLEFSTYRNLLTPDHTGDKDMGLEVVKSGDAFYLEGDVEWEDGGVTSNVKMAIDADEADKILSAEEPQKSEYIEAAFERYIENLTGRHKSFMKQHRLAIWTHEEFEFTQMFERLPK